MAIQTIDEFAKHLSPSVKKALNDASVGSTLGRKKCLAAAYPEEGRVTRLRELANAIKSLPPSKLVEQAADSLGRHGIKVLFASDADEARKMILSILRSKNAKNILKVKSMTSEEIELNDFLAKNGIDAVETDLGELIIQLEHEKPSHIVKPAIHRTREDIARSFQTHGIAPYDDNPQHITLAARKYLRKKYFSADAVVSGANYVLAKEGAIVLATNEGNARFSMAGAKTHIAIAGFEKVMDLIKAVRTLRADMGVHPAKRTSLIIETADKTPFEDGAAYLAKFAFANEVSFTEKYTGDTKGVAQVVTHAARAFIPMMELIDREKEQARLAKEKAQCEKEIASMAAKLSNEGFVNKAPAHIVEDMRQKHAAAAEKLAKIEESIRNLG